MTETTTAIPSMVAAPEITISQRMRATICAWAGLSGSSSAIGSVMSEVATRLETVIVAAGEPAERLARALTAHLEELSRSRLKALILAGHVTIGGRTIRDPSHHVN